MNNLRRAFNKCVIAFAVLGALTVVSCAGLLVWIQYVPDIDDATTVQIEAYADRVWLNGVAAHKGEDWWYDQIPEAEWPDEVRKLNPSSVSANKGGLRIETGYFFVESWGYFVLPIGSTFKPNETGDPYYRLLKGRVYRYKVVG